MSAQKIIVLIVQHYLYVIPIDFSLERGRNTMETTIQ